MNIKVNTITKTALMLALLLIMQYATKGISQQLVTGSLVNLILIITGVFVGVYGGLFVAAISPVLAFLIQIGPKLPIFIPFIIVANMLLVFITAYVYKRFETRKTTVLYSTFTGSVIAGAILKFLFLYATIVVIILPILKIPAKQVDVLTKAFSVTQLFTALIGGAIAIVILPILNKALKKH